MTKMLIDRAAVEQALEALNRSDYLGWQLNIPIIKALRAALAEQAEPDDPQRRCGGPGCDMKCCQPVEEPDLSRCPKCGGPADNGHDREVPPNPYYCTKCMAEPVAWRWGYRSVTTGEMDWRGYVEIAAHPNLRSPAIIMEPLYTAPPQRKPLTEEEILKAVGWDRAEMYMKLTPNFPVAEAKKETLKNARAIERAHGIKE